MKTVGPFVAARPLDSPPLRSAERGVATLHALDRLTGMPALVYVLPQAVVLPQLPETPSLLPYTEAGVQGTQAYVACELPPHAGLASDPLQTALGGLRALNALHEAGITHGGVGPYQLWEWDGEVRLAGAGLPWGEPQGALAAPEGGSSPAADLYALGVTLLRMGPLPVGLSDLLSPFPAQRPSARDALARFNAGPPLPAQRMPLIVEAPLHARTESAAPDLPVIAGPHEWVAFVAGASPAAETVSNIPVFDWEEVNSGELLQHLEALGTHAAAQNGGVAEPVQGEVLPAAEVEPEGEPQPGEGGAEDSELLNFLSAFPTPERPASENMDGAEDQTSAAAEPPPAEPAESVNAAQVALGAHPEPSPLEVQPESNVIVVTAQRPGVPEPQVQERVSEQVAEALPQTSPSVEPVGSADAAPPTSGLIVIGPEEVGPQARPVSETPAPAATRASSRQLKPVKIGWSQDGSWQVKKGAAAALPQPAEDEPRPFVRQRASVPVPSKLSPLRVLALVVLLLLAVLLIRSLGRSGRAAALDPACCTFTAQLVGKAGQGLSAPVTLSVVSAPGGSRLSAGTRLGQVPGPLRLDVPGSYALKVMGEGYAPQTVNVNVPTTQPLVITLQ